MQDNSINKNPTEEKFWRVLLRGWLADKDSTLDVLLKWGLIMGTIWLALELLVLPHLEEWRQLEQLQIESIKRCDPPAHLLTRKELPVIDTPKSENITYQQEIEWYLEVIETYQVWGADMVADRNQVIALCR